MDIRSRRGDPGGVGTGPPQARNGRRRSAAEDGFGRSRAGHRPSHRLRCGSSPAARSPRGHQQRRHSGVGRAHPERLRVDLDADDAIGAAVPAGSRARVRSRSHGSATEVLELARCAVGAVRALPARTSARIPRVGLAMFTAIPSLRVGSARARRRRAGARPRHRRVVGVDVHGVGWKGRSRQLEVGLSQTEQAELRCRRGSRACRVADLGGRDGVQRAAQRARGRVAPTGAGRPRPRGTTVSIAPNWARRLVSRYRRGQRRSASRSSTV